VLARCLIGPYGSLLVVCARAQHHSRDATAREWRARRKSEFTPTIVGGRSRETRKAVLALPIWRRQCSADASVRPNSAIGASNGCASSVMQKNVPRIVPFGVAIRVQLVYSNDSPGLRIG